MKELELKHDLLRLIMDLEDVKLLQQIKKMISGKAKEEYDWADDLSEAQLKQIEIGKWQIQTGQTYSHEQVEAEIDALLNSDNDEE
jgi:hypothetical protein